MEESPVETKQKKKRGKTGVGKRSKARIGQSRKGQHRHVAQKQDDSISITPHPSIPSDWLNVSGSSSDVRLCQVTYQESLEHCPPLVVTRSLVVSQTNQTWKVHVNGHLLDPARVSSLADVPTTMDSNTTTSLLEQLGQLKTCAGNPDEQFISLAKARKNGCFLSSSKEVMAYLDTNACVSCKGQTYPATVHTSKCLLLSINERCVECSSYRKTLFALHYRALRQAAANKSKSASHTNYRYMKTPERLKILRKARQTIRTRDKQIARMKKRLEELSTLNGVEVGDDVEEEIKDAIKNHNDEMSALPPGDFRRVFWDQQVSASKAKTKTAIRWHPLFIRWCLSLSRVSPKAYEIMRESGIQLPTRRTLNDYTHWVSAKPGFQNEIDDMLVREAHLEKLEDCKRYVVLIFDEMKIREDLVYDKTGHHLHGFVNLGDVNSQLQQLQKHISDDKPHEQLATMMLTLMVRGIFFKLEYPYASFPTTGVTAEVLYWIVWEAVRRLEESNLKVIAFICDGAKSNRKFLKGLGFKEEMKEGVFYKTINRYSQDRYIYFISDVPHLVKTVRNCWYSSQSGGTHYMWNNGKHILWEHLLALYEYTQTSSGLYIGHRLTYDHVHLTSYSKMKVSLAAQVLSNSSKCGFEMMKNDEYNETARFCHMLDRFFDCLNTRSIGEGRNKRKPDLEPYTSDQDERLNWLEREFLGYIKEWEKSIEMREGYSKTEKNKMLLSDETRKGLKMTVLSFVEMARYLLKEKSGLFLLSERFTQDPLESFFGQQRARGGSSDNPNSRTFLYNAQAIRVQRTMTIGHGGNVQKQKRPLIDDVEDLSRPLCKRPRKCLHYNE